MTYWFIKTKACNTKSVKIRGLFYPSFYPFVFSELWIRVSTFCTGFATFVKGIMSASPTSNMCLLAGKFTHRCCSFCQSLLPQN